MPHLPLILLQVLELQPATSPARDIVVAVDLVLLLKGHDAHRVAVHEGVPIERGDRAIMLHLTIHRRPDIGVHASDLGPPVVDPDALKEARRHEPSPKGDLLHEPGQQNGENTARFLARNCKPEKCKP